MLRILGMKWGRKTELFIYYVAVSALYWTISTARIQCARLLTEKSPVRIRDSPFGVVM